MCEFDQHRVWLLMNGGLEMLTAQKDKDGKSGLAVEGDYNLEHVSKIRVQCGCRCLSEGAQSLEGPRRLVAAESLSSSVCSCAVRSSNS